jgi:hypothetical protein
MIICVCGRWQQFKGCITLFSVVLASNVILQPLCTYIMFNFMCDQKFTSRFSDYELGKNLVLYMGKYCIFTLWSVCMKIWMTWILMAGDCLGDRFTWKDNIKMWLIRFWRCRLHWMSWRYGLWGSYDETSSKQQQILEWLKTISYSRKTMPCIKVKRKLSLFMPWRHMGDWSYSFTYS